MEAASADGSGPPQEKIPVGTARSELGSAAEGPAATEAAAAALMPLPCPRPVPVPGSDVDSRTYQRAVRQRVAAMLAADVGLCLDGYGSGAVMVTVMAAACALLLPMVVGVGVGLR